MKSSFVSDKYGTIVYQESFWTGKKVITFNGIEATKMDRKTFTCWKDGVATTFVLKGNYLAGVKLTTTDECYQVVPASTWYEYLLAILPFLFDIVWGNLRAVQQYFPIVGGFVGGLITGLAMVGSLLVSKLVKKPLYKILIGLGFAVAGIGLCYLIAIIIIAAAAK